MKALPVNNGSVINQSNVFFQDESKESASPLKEVPVDVVLEEQNEELRLKEELEKTRNKARLERGLAPIDGGHDDAV